MLFRSGALHPGKAYFVRTSGEVEVTFGGCEKTENLTDLPTLTGFQTLSGLGSVTVTPTPSSHTIAVRPEALKELEPGSVIGIFDQAGTCHSLSPASDETHCLSAFGQDPVIAQTSGFQEGEIFIIKILNPETGDEFLAEAEYDLNLPNAGKFVQNGLSAIKSLKTTGTGNFGESQIAISVYPNPSTSVFNISLSEQVSDVKWEVTGAYGAWILEGISGQNPFTIDLSTHPKGIYYLKINIGGLQLVKKLVLQ